MSFFELRRQLTYKAAMRSSLVVVADRWFPSSKTCSVCGTIQEKMPLAVRQWTCPDCGCVHDRDVNAAINLKHLAVSSTVSACGEEDSGADRKVGVKPASKKQEISFEPVSDGTAVSAVICTKCRERSELLRTPMHGATKPEPPKIPAINRQAL